jgi:sugar/nucleoside kinase (ribokinase family)
VRVGVVGAATEDTVTLDDGPSQFRPGGTPHYAARALRFAGAEPQTVETSRIRSLIEHGPGGTRQEILSLPDPLTPERARRDVLPALEGCDWVLLGGQTAGDFPAATIAALAAAGHRICLDGQGLARGSRVGPVRLGPIAQRDVAGVTALKLNQAEAAAAGPRDVPELLVTRAEHGVLVRWRDELHEILGDGRRFTDPTGAGDSFAALYCLERSRDVLPPAAALFAVRAVERLYAEPPRRDVP